MWHLKNKVTLPSKMIMPALLFKSSQFHGEIQFFYIIMQYKRTREMAEKGIFLKEDILKGE